MADAEVIPLGTRGRPGRGSGSSKPSSAARSLAGPAAARTGDVPAAEAGGHDVRRRHSGAGGPRGGRRSRGGRVLRRQLRPAARSRLSERGAHGGHPVRRLAGGLHRRPPWRSSGSAGSPALAEFLAFLRRRVTGDYDGRRVRLRPRGDRAVPAGRPASGPAENWFRVEVRGSREHPRRRAARSSWPTTPARFPSTG